MRKMKKINGYLVVRFNDREKREYEGTGLGSYGVIDAEQYTGILDIDRSVMEYDDADTLEMAMEQARELESELDIVEPETKITVIIEGETEVSEEDVEPERLFRQQKAQLENQLQRGPHMDLTPLTAAHELYGYTRALADLGIIDSHDERFMVERDIFGASAQPPDCQEEDLAYICDELCKYREGRTQEDLDAICAKCRVDRKAGAPPTLTPREVRDLRSLFRMMEEVEDYVNGGDDQKPTPHHLHRGAAERMIQRLEMKLPEGTTLKTIQDLMDTSPAANRPGRNSGTSRKQEITSWARKFISWVWRWRLIVRITTAPFTGIPSRWRGNWMRPWMGPRDTRRKCCSESCGSMYGSCGGCTMRTTR